jgi:hypothetical protein
VSDGELHEQIATSAPDDHVRHDVPQAPLQDGFVEGVDAASVADPPVAVLLQRKRRQGQMQAASEDLLGELVQGRFGPGAAGAAIGRAGVAKWWSTTRPLRATRGVAQPGQTQRQARPDATSDMWTIEPSARSPRTRLATPSRQAKPDSGAEAAPGLVGLSSTERWSPGGRVQGKARVLPAAEVGTCG